MSRGSSIKWMKSYRHWNNKKYTLPFFQRPKEKVRVMKIETIMYISGLMLIKETYQVTDFMRSRNMEEDMAEDRDLWRFGGDGQLLAI